MKRDQPLTFHQKLFGDGHAPDLVGTYVPPPVSETLTDNEIIANLKATSRILGERKAQVDSVIMALEKKTAGLSVEAPESEKEDEVEDDSGDEEEDVGTGDGEDGSANEDEEEDSEKEDEDAGKSEGDEAKEDDEEQSGSSSEAEEE
jgi:hypothetical protein